MKAIFLKNAQSKKIIAIGCLLAIALVLPGMNISNYIISVSVSCFIFSALGGAWNIIGGYAGQISWCHAGFVSIGAYTSYLLFLNFKISPFIGMAIAAMISAALAFFIGFISFRMRGPFFSLATIAFAEIIRVLLLYLKDITGGAAGLVIPYSGNNFWNLSFKNDNVFYYIMLALMCITTYLSYRIKKSNLGYYLRAIKADEDAAASLSIETYKIKIRTFVISAAITSIIGAFYAFFVAYIDPLSMGGLELSTRIGSMAIVGGAGTVFGPILGAFSLVLLGELASIVFGASGATMLPYGVALVLIIIFRPGGLISFFTPQKSKNMSILNKLKMRKGS